MSDRFFLQNEAGNFYEILCINNCLYIEKAIEYFYIPENYIVVGTYSKEKEIHLKGYTLKSIFVKIGESKK